MLYAALNEPDANAARLVERAAFQALGASEDCAEGLAAHRERRAPRWRRAKSDVPMALRRAEGHAYASGNPGTGQ
jgi:hypothetical protein